MKTPFDKNSKILGHQDIIDYLNKSVKNGQFSQAYLFLGRSGLGKKTVALNFFQSILCHSNDKNTAVIPCAECPSCEEFVRGQYPDIYIIEREAGKKNISIEQLRSLRHKLSLKSPRAAYKFVIINEAETLSSEAANSFLKTLEEPAPKTIIILISSNEEAIPKTVLSRCQILRYRSISREYIYEYLKVCKNLKSPTAKVIAELSRGCPGRAIKIAEDPDFLEAEERKIDQFLDLFRASLGHRLGEVSRIKLADDISSEMGSIFDTWQEVSRDLLLSKLGLNDLLSQPSKKVIFHTTAEKKDLDHFQNILNFSLIVPRLLKMNINPKIVLENYLLNI